MNGMEMMLKSFGFDIEKIQKDMKETIDKIIGGIKILADRQETTRQIAERTEQKLDLLMKELRVNPAHLSTNLLEDRTSHETNGAGQ